MRDTVNLTGARARDVCLTVVGRINIAGCIGAKFSTALDALIRDLLETKILSMELSMDRRNHRKCIESKTRG